MSVGARMRFYRAYNVVFARKSRAMQTLFKAPDEELRPYLERMVLRDLGAQADGLQLERPSERFPLQLLDVGDRVPVSLNKRAHRLLYVGAVRHIDFMTTLELEGHWSVGGLQNRGYGSVRRQRALRGDTATPIRVKGDCHAAL